MGISGTIIVFGSRGLVGSTLMELLEDQDAHGFDQSECDVTKPDQVKQVLNIHNPDLFINCTGFTNVDGCESDTEKAWLLNAEVPGILAESARENDCRIIHLSTDFVFDGTLDRPITEDDAPNPLSVYGRTKLAGEEAVKAQEGDWLIIRTAWLFGHHGNDFVRTILKLANKGVDLKIVDDQTGTPTYAFDFGRGLIRLAQANAGGIVNLTNSGQATWYDLARTALDLADLSHIPIKPITSEELGRPAARPAYSVLDTSLYQSLTGHQLRPWEEALDEALKRELFDQNED